MTNSPATKIIVSSEFAAGQIVHFYGARFRLRDDVKTHDKTQYDEIPVTTATGDWIDGNVVRGYFGPNTPWKFQGNDRASWAIEIEPDAGELSDREMEIALYGDGRVCTYQCPGAPNDGERIFNTKEMDAEMMAESARYAADADEWQRRQKDL